MFGRRNKSELPKVIADDDQAESEERRKSAERLLGSPVLLDASEEVSKTRLRLLTFSALAIAICYFNLRIGEDAGFLGLKISGLNDGVVRKGLFLVVVYLVVHFAWSISDALKEWRLRLTGINDIRVQMHVSISKEIEAAPNPRQLTLYSWWVREGVNVGTVGTTLNRANAMLDRFQSQSPAAATPDIAINSLEFSKYVEECRDILKRLNHEVPKARAILESPQLTEKLRRFDQRFRYFLVSQNLRWLVFDFLAPLIVGLAALILLVTSRSTSLGV